jgi:hypothetical protein
MKRNKELFFEYRKNKANLSKFLEEPVSIDKFIEIISTIKNINLDNNDFINSFYEKYSINIFQK